MTDPDQERRALFNFPNDIPIIYVNEKIIVNKIIHKITYFKSWFSPHRSNVNPSVPVKKIIDDRTIISFNKTGEYYLILDNNHKLKVLVLDDRHKNWIPGSHHQISDNVVRIFYFLAANHVSSVVENTRHQQNQEKYIFDFFHREIPLLLTCGPSLSLFNEIINCKFNLLYRSVCWIGVYFESAAAPRDKIMSHDGEWIGGDGEGGVGGVGEDGVIGNARGKLFRCTHNVSEIYLPDLKKWVLFDLSNGFFIKWLDAFECSELLRKQYAETPQGMSLLDSTFKEKIKYDKKIHKCDLVDIYLGEHETTFEPVASDIRKFESNGLGGHPDWPDLGINILYKAMFSGPSYWAREFDPGCEYDKYVSNYTKHDIIRQEQIKWDGEYGQKLLHVEPENLKRILRDKYNV